LTGVKDHEKVRVAIDVTDPVARLAKLEGPTGDIEQMLSEIETGRR
jgi:hypothetical protein